MRTLFARRLPWHVYGWRLAVGGGGGARHVCLLLLLAAEASRPSAGQRALGELSDAHLAAILQSHADFTLHM